MLDVLTLYVSGFWPWIGITIGLAITLVAISAIIIDVFEILGRK